MLTIAFSELPSNRVAALSWMPLMEATMKSIKKQICIGILFLMVELLNIPADYGQAVYGSLYGTITDNTGAIIPNAHITVMDVSKGTQPSCRAMRMGCGGWIT